jgi:hypothetical protein
MSRDLGWAGDVKPPAATRLDLSHQASGRPSGHMKSSQATVDGVSDEPRNSATQASSRYMELFDDPQRLDEFRSMFADEFVRVDRRRLIALPAIDKATYFETQLSFAHELGDVTSDYEVLAVRGERLLLARIERRVGGDFTTEYLVVAQWDVTIPQIQRVVLFEPDDLNLAIAELDRLHSELEGGSQS